MLFVPSVLFYRFLIGRVSVYKGFWGGLVFDIGWYGIFLILSIILVTSLLIIIFEQYLYYYILLKTYIIIVLIPVGYIVHKISKQFIFDFKKERYRKNVE
jgi:hypothetical protein